MWCVTPSRTPTTTTTTHTPTPTHIPQRMEEISVGNTHIHAHVIPSRKGHITSVVKARISLNLNANLAKLVCLLMKEISVGNIKNTSNSYGRKWKRIIRPPTMGTHTDRNKGILKESLLWTFAIAQTQMHSLHVDTSVCIKKNILHTYIINRHKMDFHCNVTTHASDISWRCADAEMEPLPLYNSSAV